MAPATTYDEQTLMYIDINLYMNIYKWVFAQVISMSAPCDFNRKNKKCDGRFRKKDFIYALQFFVSLTFCTYLKEAYFCFWADRAVFTLGRDIVQYVYVFLFICI